jgi:hypothetical protein
MIQPNFPPLRKIVHLRGSTGLVLLILLSFSLHLSAQKPLPVEGGTRLPYIIEGNDTIPVVNLPIVNIDEFANPDYLKNLKEYYRLRFNVIKVYPYARLASVKLNEMNRRMESMSSERERRRYKKQVEEQVRKDFEDQIKKLSINQGNVLIKLIDRETGSTTYDLIRQMKGSLNAFFSQGVAKLFNHDLKDEYDPTGRDKAIENVVQQIERGEITF